MTVFSNKIYISVDSIATPIKYDQDEPEKEDAPEEEQNLIKATWMDACKYFSVFFVDQKLFN